MLLTFVNDWRHLLGDTVQVTVYDGIIVTIRLERDDGRIYFVNGWEQFFHHHNLQEAHVLVFEYKGNSTFNMTIFDHSGLEVTYDSGVPEEYNVSHTDNLVFEITLTPHHNSQRKIVGVIFNISFYIHLFHINLIPRSIVYSSTVFQCIQGRFSRYHLSRCVRNVQIHDSLHYNWELATNLRPNSLIRRMIIGRADFFIEK